MFEARSLHRGGTVCIAEARCLANLGGSWRPGVPSLGEVQKSSFRNHRHLNEFCGMHESIF